MDFQMKQTSSVFFTHLASAFFPTSFKNGQIFLNSFAFCIFLGEEDSS